MTSLVERFATVYSGLGGASATPELAPVRLAMACVAVLPIAGAGISIFSGSDVRVPIGASDDVAAAAERLQFTADEGPCLDAHRAEETVIATEPDLAERWPVFHRGLVAQTPYHSILAFPLSGELSGLGSVDLYLRGRDEARRVPLADVGVVATVLTNKLLEEELFSVSSPEPRWLDSPVAVVRNQLMIAIGMLAVAEDVGASDALALIRRHALSTNQTVDEITTAVVNREVPISRLVAREAEPG